MMRGTHCVGFWLRVSRSGAWHISEGKYPFPHEQRGKSGTTPDYLAVFRSTHRRKPRISAEDKISLADNLRLPGIPRCGRVIRQAYHVWGVGDASILFSQRTGGGRAAAPGTARERACLPAGSDDREPARGDGAGGGAGAGWAEPVSGLRMA